MINSAKNKEFVNDFWDKTIIPILSKYISIPCKSIDYDPNWQTSGYLAKAAALIAEWIKSQNLPGISTEIVSLQGKTPLIFVDIPASTKELADKTVVFYGHFDKMPESEGWSEGFGPWTPVLKNDLLYGRGGVDDGYAAFLPIAVIKSLHEQKIAYPRCVMLLESAEESGSIGFMDYVHHLKNKIGEPTIIAVMDAGGEDYDHMWCTTSLRGMVDGILKVEVLTRAVHSGMGTGIIPSSFRILRELLSRVENEKTGELLPEFSVSIPNERVEQAKLIAKIIGKKLYTSQPFAEGVKPVTEKLEELVLNSTWRSGLEVISMEGFPPIANAGNVIRPTTSAKISVRLPPNCDPTKVGELLKKTFETKVPYDAKVTFTPGSGIAGWNAPTMEKSLIDAINIASKTYFGNEVAHVGCGGSIGIVQMLGEVYPSTKFIITGAEGPGSNGHGPNESLNVAAAKKLTCCMSHILASYFK
jgi:acetylornithine deacetylase/succinyl-diaminopimelate desuccinylase-like protein